MFDEDLSVFFNPAELGDVATFQFPQGPREVRGLFDNAYFSPELGETVLDTTTPRFTCAYADVIAVTRGIFVTIKGATYSVLTVQPEGTGPATVTLMNETTPPQ